MIAAIALSLALQGTSSASPPAAPPTASTAFAEILEEANRAWYELPGVTTKFTVKSEEKELGMTVEIRDGKRMCFALANEGELRLQVRSDGARTLLMDFRSRSYRHDPAVPRPAWADREAKKPAELEADTFHFEFDTSQGLVLDHPGHPFVIKSDKAVVESGFKGRRIVAEIVKPSRSGKAESRIRFSGWLDTTKGFFRRAIVLATNGDEPDKKMTIDWESNDKADPSANFELDPPGLAGWTKAGG